MPGAGDNGHETVHIPPPVNATEPKKSLWTNIFAFIEHPFTLGAFFLLGGLVGAILFTPAFVICAVCILLGFHRSGVVSGRSTKVQVVSYVVLAVVLAVGGYFLYQRLDSALQRMQTEFAKKISDSMKERHGTNDKAEVKVDHPAEPSSSNPTSNKPPESAVVSKHKTIKNPLEIVAFNSGQDISVSNNGPVSVYAIRLLVNEGNFSKSFGLNSEIGPGKTKTIPIRDGFVKVRTLRGLGDTWSEHLKKALAQYGNCWQFTFFSQSDARLFQIRDHYISEGESFIYDKGMGTIYYRLDGFQGTKEEKVPIAITVTLDAAICPGP